MKALYWRPHHVPRVGLLLVALSAAAGYFLVEKWTIKVRQPYFQEKMEAARITDHAFKVLREERLKRGLTIDPETDPANTGLIGELMTPLTTNPGSLPSKQTSVNPNFAAMIVYYLKRIGVQEGDTIAVGCSGSFPALNVATLAVVEALKLDAVIITSAASSQFGANDPHLSWLDMEKVLLEQHIIKKGSIAASLGGIEDRGMGMPKKGRTLLQETIGRVGIKFIEAPTFQDSVKERMELYASNARGDIKAYINVGGGTISVGKKYGKLLFEPGLHRSLPQGAGEVDSVMVSFLARGVPVIHLININDLAERFGLPIAPTKMPKVGEGEVFAKEERSKLLAVCVLVSILIGLYGVAGGLFFRRSA